MSKRNLIATQITYFGIPLVLICDGNCRKAWGINQRPMNQLSDEVDDYEWLSDRELGFAPIDPGTYEGDHAKPTDYYDSHRHNKWCARECERSVKSEGGSIELPDFSERVRNIAESAGYE